MDTWTASYASSVNFVPAQSALMQCKALGILTEHFEFILLRYFCIAERKVTFDLNKLLFTSVLLVLWTT